MKFEGHTMRLPRKAPITKSGLVFFFQ